VRIKIEGMDHQVLVPLREVREILKLGYISSIHKSQGSEYQYVILPFIKAHGQNMLQRNLLYTALTRAKKKVIIIGQWAAVASSIENDRIRKRNTMLSDRVKECLANAGNPEFAPLAKLLAITESAANFHAVSKMLFPGRAVDSPDAAEDEFYTE
jgi:ATP-dependent exoDNAse (exonuclease V) beta subunit